MSRPQLIRRYAEPADRVACVSSAIRQCMKDAGVTVPQDVILDGFAAEHVEEAGNKYPLSVMQASHLTAQKRLTVTLHAFARFQKNHPSARLTIMGQGAEREKLEALSRELGVEKVVRFTGEVPNAEVLAEMAKTRFFCMPSVHEGFGIVYLEAMASGCITIGTEGEGIADVVESGKNGFLVPPDDPDAIAAVLEWCLAHSEEAGAIAARGRQDALSLTWERNAEQYLRLFEELCS